MIDITSFLLRHLYEFMADNYNSNYDQQRGSPRAGQRASAAASLSQSDECNAAGCSGRESKAREQESNQQIVFFLANNQLPNLICDTFVELIFLTISLAICWIFAMILQLHCLQTASSSTAAAAAALHVAAPADVGPRACCAGLGARFLGNAVASCDLDQRPLAAGQLHRAFHQIRLSSH